MKQRAQRTGTDPALAVLAEHVVKRRRAKGISQEEAAHRAGVALRTLQNLESGRLNPSYLTLRAVAQGLEVPLRLLVSD